MEYGEIIYQYMFRRIWLVMPRPHAKYTRTVYPYILGSGCYVNLSWEQPLYIYLLQNTSYEKVINTYMFQH